MRLDAWDSVFVRARRTHVHAVLSDLPAYPCWWPGLAVHGGGAGRLVVSHRPAGRLLGRHRVDMRVTRDRPALGVDFAYAGDLAGEAEWYYLDEADGVVVHYLLRASTRQRRARALLATHRASVRAALHALKDRLEGDRLPGAEPDPRLLAHQRQAIAAFRADVEAHAARQARLARKPPP